MSLCQSKGSSCGACCGLFNLDYPANDLKKILEERTTSFNTNVNYSKRETVIAYREEFEIKENPYPKKDKTVYNCPFLGYIDSSHKKIGCMIHPISTGDSKSQNYSFYGASICQTYDCRNKERKNNLHWENFLTSLELDYYKYSNLAGDHILITRIEEFFYECGISIESMFTDHSELLKKALLHKFLVVNSHITSFEIDMVTNVKISKFQHLVDRLELKNDDSLYGELEFLVRNSKKNSTKI